jgi:guanyl-specific ribonuclease Sa
MVRRRKTQPLVFVIVALAVVLTGWWQQQQSGTPAPAPSAVEASPPAGPAASPPPQASSPSRLDSVPSGERPQLERTLALIARGGPFPHAKDGTVFQNRENRLPARPRGYYREYTVPTPGASNRGARRVVQGKDGDTWYTSDHYNTFVRIDE